MLTSDIQLVSMALRKERRVVVFADLVESVRLMQYGEADAIQRWLHFAAQARGHIVPRHGGNLVRTAGDGLMMEFATAPGAVAAAFELHASLVHYNDGVTPEQSMWLRVGLHVTDAVAADNDLYGAGVNLAARLGSLAQPGQTTASVELCSQLTHGVHADIEDTGQHYLKHLAEPVRVFKLRPPGSEAAFGDGANLAPKAAPTDLRPALAVVPFTCHPADPGNDALGYAMADDIIAALARHPGLRVLSRMSTAALRDTTLDLPRLQTLLGATYLLTGRFYVQGSRARTSVELCDMRNGDVLWTGSAMAEVAALFEGQDDLVPHVVSNVSQVVMAHELSRVRSLPMTTLESYSLFVGATGLMNSLVHADFKRSKEVLDHLVDRHPRQAAPYAMLARWHVFKIVQDWTDDATNETHRVQDLARRAVDIDPLQPCALVASGVAKLFLDDDHVGARACFEQALRTDPCDAEAWGRLAEVTSIAGEHAAAMQCAYRSLAVSPLDQQRYLLEAYAARAAYGADAYAESAALAQASVRKHALHAPSHRQLIVALWQEGRKDDARVAVRRYLQAIPKARVGANPSARLPNGRLSFAEALRLAGLPQ